MPKEFFIGGGMDERQFEALRGELAAQIEGLKAELAGLADEADLSPLMDPEALAALWEEGGIEVRRALIQAALTSVTVKPPKGRGDKTSIFDRLVPVWQDKTSDTRPLDAGFTAASRGRADSGAAPDPHDPAPFVPTLDRSSRPERAQTAGRRAH